jgi:phosphoribosylanthranilate isomerase
MGNVIEDIIGELSPALSGNLFVVGEQLQKLPPEQARLIPPPLRNAIKRVAARTCGSAEGYTGLLRDADLLNDLAFSARRALFPIKICGLSTPDTMAAALDAGADMVGLVFHRKSPRSLSLETAAELAAMARGKAIIVALTVDPSDEGIDAIMSHVNPDLIQLHGSETPERCTQISERIDRPVMKALGVAEAADLAAIKAYRPHIDRLLLDAKPPKDAAYPGGHGKTFDWAILKGLDPFMPFMLSGGLTPENVGEAITIVKALGITLAGVDVSSGVESAPGVKDVDKIKAFIANARTASLKAIA